MKRLFTKLTSVKHFNGRVVATYRLYTEKGFKTLYEIDSFEDGTYALDWDDRRLLAKTPLEDRLFETLSDAVLYAEKHLQTLRNSDSFYKLNLCPYYPLCISEKEAKLFTEHYWKIENPWKNIA